MSVPSEKRRAFGQTETFQYRTTMSFTKKNGKKKSTRRRSTESAETLAQNFLQKLSARAGCPEQFRLVELWRNWRVVMGEEISSLCLPLGHREHRLDLGTEDSMAMQELLYLEHEIVQRANAFLESPFFNDVKVTLLGERSGLAEEPDRAVVTRKTPQLPRMATGRYLQDMDPDSAIARCYRAYCRSEEEREGD